MPEKFEGGEKPKNFSEEEIERAQDLVSKIREVVEWDLGKLCGTTEELDFIHKAKDAMKEVEAMFDMPKTRSWVEEETEEHKPKPIVPKTFSPDDIQRLRSNLDAIDEVVGWDISAADETEITMLRDARKSVEALKGMV